MVTIGKAGFQQCISACRTAITDPYGFSKVISQDKLA